VLRVGLCGTDAEINHGLYGKAPDGDEFLILGHENLGVVEQVGKKVKGWKTGDLVVSTVRRPCGVCPQCKSGENDMCSSGQYTERGIMRRHGFMAQYYVESPAFLNKIRRRSDSPCSIEPMSVVRRDRPRTCCSAGKPGSRRSGWCSAPDPSGTRRVRAARPRSSRRGDRA
jgi:threonine dehydrogenase-like Zn-dependent dehydrogenase